MLKASEQPMPPPENYFRFTYDNDLFSGTDRYYTQGVMADLIHPFVKRSPVSRVLPVISKSARNYYGLHLEQDVFTPKSITYMGGAVYYGERPYTAVFFLSHTLASLDLQRMQALRTQLDLGIIGPNALGEEEQTAIHKATNNSVPLGWQHQLAQDIVINYRATFEKGLVNIPYFDMVAQVNGRAGTLYTDAGAGLQLRAGLFSAYFNNLGLQKNATGRNRFMAYVIARGTVRMVGYNATLQGGVFNRSSEYTLPAADITRTVAEAAYGVVLGYKRVCLELTKTYITPEFKKGLDHSWGRCALSVCF